MSKDRKEYFKKHNREYYLKHKEEILKKQKEYRIENKEKISERKKKYFKNNQSSNKVLTELEEWLKAVYEDYDDWKDEYRYSTYITAINETFDKIQELKEKYK